MGNDIQYEEMAIRLKYLFRQLLHGPKSSPMQDNSRAVLSMSQLTMLNITSLPACHESSSRFLTLHCFYFVFLQGYLPISLPFFILGLV